MLRTPTAAPTERCRAGLTRRPVRASPLGASTPELAAAGTVFAPGISTFPLKIAPSAIAIRGALTLPCIDPPALSSNFSLTVRCRQLAKHDDRLGDDLGVDTCARANGEHVVRQVDFALDLAFERQVFRPAQLALDGNRLTHVHGRLLVRDGGERRGPEYRSPTVRATTSGVVIRPMTPAWDYRRYRIPALHTLRSPPGSFPGSCTSASRRNIVQLALTRLFVLRVPRGPCARPPRRVHEYNHAPWSSPSPLTSSQSSGWAC